MKDNVIHIGEANEDSFSFSPIQILQSTIEEIEHGDIVPTRIMIILLDDKEDEYNVFCRMAQLRHSDCVTLLEYAKYILLKTMSRDID